MAGLAGLKYIKYEVTVDPPRVNGHVHVTVDPCPLALRACTGPSPSQAGIIN